MLDSESVEWTYTMILSLHARRLEFDNVILDLSQLELNDGQPENHYIVFLNVKRAFYKNFIVSCDMSLETFALHVYQNAQLTVDGVAVPRAPDFANYISFNASDRDQSLVLDLGPNARIVVAKQLRSNERYHQRVSGFLDFQRRHQPFAVAENNPIVRNALDRELEIKLYCLCD
ncbi:hypothetical protein Spob087 [Spilosoma obliqua nucleopolyhedrosis virus]|uniref:ORF93 peptide n=1 Tax=Hyphantria cunea nuclear polyhedrosis virus TaxID=28288 RepID=Q2NP18_NPVHC|nr:ORF93 peptide [Hyphantria cunea nucleopolyhedrovirus]AUR45118.1 hypothetical protein Spob087 [Spilosoma obliqua nucleopolyhedrosis virus]BAE72382.1 ORF93 peptide [Hyphantria cunea nucleopolyhedrovirus]